MKDGFIELTPEHIEKGNYTMESISEVCDDWISKKIRSFEAIEEIVNILDSYSTLIDELLKQKGGKHGKNKS